MWNYSNCRHYGNVVITESVTTHRGSIVGLMGHTHSMAGIDIIGIRNAYYINSGMKIAYTVLRYPNEVIEYEGNEHRWNIPESLLRQVVGG